MIFWNNFSYDAQFLLVILGSYLIGAIPFSIIFSYFFSLDDPRSYGSNNPGATNVLRSGNRFAAALTLLFDVAKGFLAVSLAHFLFESSAEVIAVVGVSVVIGHVFSIYLRFKGGKGVATGIGVVLGFHYLLGVIFLLTWLLVAKITKISSLSALTSFIIVSVLSVFIFDRLILSFSLFLITLLLFYTHRQNIKNLYYKKESRIQ